MTYLELSSRKEQISVICIKIMRKNQTIDHQRGQRKTRTSNPAAVCEPP
jgi:hypothetical protein